MCDLRGRINSLRSDILEETSKDLNELRVERILELCIRHNKLLKEYISCNCL